MIGNMAGLGGTTPTFSSCVCVGWSSGYALGSAANYHTLLGA